MLANLATCPGDPSKPNLDWCGATATCALVLDGVSEPAGTETGCRHGTEWYVQQLGSTLLRYASLTSLPLTDMLAHAIEDVRREHGGLCNLDHPGSPAATAVILRQRGKAMDYLVLSDSTLVMDLDDGLLVVTNAPADDVVPTEREQVYQHPPGSYERAVNLARMVAAQRQFRNIEGGYWVASTIPEAAQHARIGTVDAARFGSALLLSDGVTRLHEWGISSLDSMLATARRHGPDSLIKWVRSVEQSSSPEMRPPQFRSSDDATAVLVLP